jgi:transposase
MEQSAKKIKYREIERDQTLWADLCIEDLIGCEHPARLIWEVMGQLDLSEFEKDGASFEREAGRARWSPRLLLSVLTYGYTLGTSSARELERWMEHEPGLRWLVGLERVNHHTLSDFRTQKLERLKQIFEQVLALLGSEGLVDFGTLLQDGTKMKAQAGKGSFHREKTLSEHLEAARACVEQTDRQSEEDSGTSRRKQAARERARRERRERMEAAMQELQQRQETARSSGQSEVRVSETEPEARKMKHADGAFAPSYNVQFVTEAKNGFIVGVAVSTDCNDQQQLEPGVETAEAMTGQKAHTVIADAGYATRDNIEAMAQLGTQFVAPRIGEEQRQAGAMKKAGIAAEFAAARFMLQGETLQCPAGAALVQIGGGKHHGLNVIRYQASAETCAVCPNKPQCCPVTAARTVERILESEAVREHDQRMQEPVVQQLYRKRKQLAEFPNMRIKSGWGFRRFRLRGLRKVTQETFWMVLAFTLDRLSFLRRQASDLQLAAA